MTDDLIKRQDAIDAMQKYCDEDCYDGNVGKWCGNCNYNELVELIKELPSAQPEVIACGDGELKSESQWIPCSERLPKEETDVLVTRRFLGLKNSSNGWNDHIPPKTYVEVAHYFCGEWTALSDEYKIARNRHTDPIAWMPLPEPYKGVEL